MISEKKTWPFAVKWSSKLEKLADELLLETQNHSGEPFRKACIVVHDSATANWLKQYFLLERRIPQILMGVDFVRLPEFLNDWLAAAIRGVAPRERDAADHPYCTDVLTWRIYNILSQPGRNDDLKELQEYIGEDGNEERDAVRRFGLSQSLAKLYDGYLNSRCQMLRNWETGRDTTGKEVPRWQISLYRRLVQENSQTYAADYEKAFSPDTDARTALRNGFPSYRAVHVFDIPFMSEPDLHLLEKISQAVPMTFWVFNPKGDEWVGETVSRNEAVRQLRQEWSRQRTALQEGWLEQSDAFTDFQKFYDSPSERLLGALASGARALIRNLCDDVGGDIDVVGENEALEELSGRELQIHSSYSPRRELESIKDGLLDFFARNPGLSPHDAIVLCADWDSYAPLIESVFGAPAGSRGNIPVSLAGGVAGDTPFCQSLRDLLSFRSNRFEVNAVFRLLRMPAIQRKFGLDGQAVDFLWAMVKEANIHWGYDDADVQRILGEEAVPDVHYAFTWQRGLDRMTAEMLHGFRETEYTFLDAGGIGMLRPCGEVEGDRAGFLAMLWDFIQKLNWLRQVFAPEKQSTPAELREALQEVIRTFYDESVCKETLPVMRMAGDIARQMTEGAVERAGAEVFLSAVQAALTGSVPGMRTPGDAVLFAPLNPSTATPHSLVWICGLNDGKFPRIEHRPSYDIIGKCPSFFDATARERDSFALLKAALSARKRLCLSYVGMDSHTNEEIPPSVLLNDLKDFFDEEKMPYAVYKHPMNGYSARYFAEGNAASLPPSYSSRNAEIAKALRRHEEIQGIIPFPLSQEGVTEIQLEDLAGFLASPNQYLFRVQGIRVPRGDGQWEDKEALSVRLGGMLLKDTAFAGRAPEHSAESLVESGGAPDVPSAQSALDGVPSLNDRMLFEGSSVPLLQAYQQYLEVEKECTPREKTVELQAAGAAVRIHMQCTSAEFEGRRWILWYDAFPESQTTLNRVFLHHLGANAMEGGITTVLFGLTKNGVWKPAVTVFSAMSPADARAELSEITALCATPLPAGYPDYRKTSPKEDMLPEDWQKRLSAFIEASEKEG